MDIQIPFNDANEIKKQHDSMAAWHQAMADSHARAAGWHGAQSDKLSKAMKEVPLDPEVMTDTIGSAKGGNTGEKPSATPSSQEVPLDPMKKAEFVQILKDHADLFQNLGTPIEKIAETVLGI